jgi:pyruvate,water dikinase
MAAASEPPVRAPMTTEGPNWFRRVLSRLARRATEPHDAEAAKELFQTRYHALRLLLAANTKALELMAAMERAAAHGTTFGMPFVHSHCTAVGVSVFQMVRHLDTLAPGKYAALFDRLQKIQRQIDLELTTHPFSSDGPIIVPLTEINRSFIDVAGAKMANLGEVADVVGMSVPSGFVITTAAYERLIAANDLQPEIDRLLLAHQADRLDELFALSSELQALILSAEVPDDIAETIDAAAGEIAQSTTATSFALRSSALGEDSADASFAGQYQSLLNVRRAHLVDSYLEVVASKYTPQAMHYRLQRGLRDDDVKMSVGCLEMIDARSGGVVYTGNPGDRDDDNIYISSAWGLPKAIVDGRFASDLLVVERTNPSQISKKTIGNKEQRFVLDSVEGVERAEVPQNLRQEPSLNDKEATRIADLALRLERHFGAPVDVEWAISKGGQLMILQCRPLAQSLALDRQPLPDGTPPPVVEGGVCASPGAAAGIVHRVSRDSDALTCPDGAVLVLEQPLPRWAALLGRVAAVVAEEGGIAGHLATVARELAVPAVLGTGCLDVLVDGREVTVDASGGAVYPGRIEALLVGREELPAPRAETPVLRTLRDALRHIVPLNLLDPDGVDFTPSACRTLHDITRFCHEQAVREIFAFGTETEFPEFASKQLHYNVPMQWWVLDLGGGFKQPVSGKYVHLEDIACKPMLALWDGLVAVPWDGPPATSGRGLASILFEATANPALATPFRKPYADRNYFIISEHFINLQSRFGFHFTNVEALAGSRPEENYLSFSFKGGAANIERRVARARFIGDLLAEQNFEIQVKEDVVVARRTGLERAKVEQGLGVVGYLLMHTRQLDMVMSHPATVERYLTKMRTDIQTLRADESSS